MSIPAWDLSSLQVSILFLRPYEKQKWYVVQAYLCCTGKLESTTACATRIPCSLISQPVVGKEWAAWHIPHWQWVTSSSGMGAACGASDPTWLSARRGTEPLAYRFPRKPLLYAVNLQESGSSDSSTISSHTAFPINVLSVRVDYFIWSLSPRRSKALTYIQQLYQYTNLLQDSYLLWT